MGKNPFDLLVYLLLVGVVLWLLYQHTRVLHRLCELTTLSEITSRYRIIALRSLTVLAMGYLLAGKISLWFPTTFYVWAFHLQGWTVEITLSALVIYVGLRPHSLQKWRTLAVAFRYLLIGAVMGLLAGYFIDIFTINGSGTSWVGEFDSYLWLLKLVHYGSLSILLVVWARFSKIQLVRMGEVFEGPKPVSVKFLMVVQLFALLLLVVIYQYFFLGLGLISSESLKLSVSAFVAAALVFLIVGNVLLLAMALAILQPIPWQRRWFMVVVFYALFVMCVFLQNFVWDNFVFEFEQMDVELADVEFANRYRFDFWSQAIQAGWMTFEMIPMLIVAVVMSLDGLRLENRRNQNLIKQKIE